MPYTVNEIVIPTYWFAKQRFQLSFLSREHYIEVMDALKNDIITQNGTLATPEYNYLILDEDFDENHLIGVTAFVAIENKIMNPKGFECIHQSKSQQVLRVESDTFDEVHSGLAKYMHDHDYMAAGPIRVILSDHHNPFVFESPYSISDE